MAEGNAVLEVSNDDCAFLAVACDWVSAVGPALDISSSQCRASHELPFTVVHDVELRRWYGEAVFGRLQ